MSAELLDTAAAMREIAAMKPPMAVVMLLDTILADVRTDALVTGEQRNARFWRCLTAVADRLYMAVPRIREQHSCAR